MPVQQTYNEEIELVSKFIKALAHPARLAILKEISKRGGQVRGELIVIDQMSSPTVQQHLRDLKKAGLIKGRIFGQNSSYGIDYENIKMLEDGFSKFIDSIAKEEE
jgi:ArsR family transcriptional regulator